MIEGMGVSSRRADAFSAEAGESVCLRELACMAQEWMYDCSFPLWAERGIDSEGYFYEALGLDGRGVEDSRRRIRVQARQTFSFALAYLLGWRVEQSARIVRHGAHMLLTGCVGSDGLYGTWLDTRTGPFGDYCLYDCAFVLLALCWSGYVLQDSDLAAQAKALASRIDSRCVHARGGYCEGEPDQGVRFQNPHMHLYEASLAHAGLMGSDVSAGRVGSIGSFVMDRFFDRRCGRIVEEWSDQAVAVSDRVEAGHQYEWTWLLHQRAFVSKRSDFGSADSIYRSALGLTGVDGRIGLSHDGDLEPFDTRRRMWVQCEALKAHLVRAESGDGAAVFRAGRSFGLLWSDHVMEDGGWTDIRDEDGKVLGDVVPASTGYHLYLALVCLMRAVGIGRAGQVPIAPGFGSVV